MSRAFFIEINFLESQLMNFQMKSLYQWQFEIESYSFNLLCSRRCIRIFPFNDTLKHRHRLISVLILVSVCYRGKTHLTRPLGRTLSY